MISFSKNLPLFALALLSVSILGAACAPTSRMEAALVTPEVAKVARAYGPTKFARTIPTDTPTATNTPVPTSTATLQPTNTRVPTRVPTKRPTWTPTVSVAPAQAAVIAPTLLPTQTAAASASCAPFLNESYTAFTLNSPPTDRPAAQHPDLNFALRGYTPTDGGKGLVDYGGDTAAHSPQLDGLFSDRRLPVIRSLYQVYDWNWDSDTRGDAINDPSVTYMGVEVTRGEGLHVPDSNTNIGLGFDALVLYAAPSRITLKYTGEDDVERGYTLHLENICVDANLLALYQQLNAAGRGQLPALRSGQAIGHAMSQELGIAIRDTGTFLDPRSRKDWWRGH